MSEKWTDEQWQAIRARHCDLLVSAGAGSGKTAVMIERICSLLGEGADICEMAVSTFTNTAAADMKRKLSKALAKKSDEAAARAKDEVDPVRKQEEARLAAHFAAQLKRLPSAEISTLHGFCARLIKAWSFDTDFDPESTVLEEGEERALKDEAAERAIAAAKESGDRDFAGLYAAFLQNRNHRRLKRAALAVYEYARAQTDPDAWLARTAERSDEEYRAFLYADVDRDAKRLIEKIERLKPSMAASGYAPDHAALLRLSDCAAAGVPFDGETPRLVKRPEYADLHEAFKEVKGEYAQICKRRQKIADMPSSDTSLPYCRALSASARALGELYAASKRARGKVDYADLEHGALRILRGEHGKEIVEKYRYVFVDEYQDINPLQEEILRCFRCEMFYVGDVKQSIYGFRMCSPEFFRAKWEAYGRGAGKTVRLIANFRSSNAILDTVNRVFSAVMTEDFGGADYKNAAFVAGKNLQGSVCARLVTVPEEESALPVSVYSAQEDACETEDGAIEAEADATVDEILDMLDGEIPDEDGEKGATRRVRYEDVAVLVRSRGAFCDVLQRKLRALSVPVTVVSSDVPADEFASVSVLLSFLHLLDNARDDVRLSAVLLSPLFGAFTTDELACIAGEGKKRQDAPTFCDAVRLYAKQGRDEALRAKTDAFLRELDGWREAAATSTASDLAGNVTAHYECFARSLSMGGAREAAALDAFLQSVADAEQDTLHDYLRYIASCGVPRIAVQDGGGAVRIFTVHASKGLEFPCVVLPNLHKQFNLGDTRADVLCDKDEGVVLRTFDFDERTIESNPRFAACARKKRREVGAEELRILYVAMTRAKYRLSLIALDKQRAEGKEAEGAGAYIDWLYGFLTEIAAQTDTAERFAQEEREQEEETDEALAATLAARFAAEEKRVRTQRSAAADAPLKASVSGVAHADDEEKTPALYGDDDRAAQKGTAYHKFMQWVQWDKTGEWERLCAHFPREGALVDRQEIEDAFARVAKFIDGRPHLREQAFVYNAAPQDVGLQGESTVLIQGVIDLMVRNEDGSVTVVDYKTGKEQNLHSEAYRKQLALYKKAAEKVLGVNVRETLLYGFSCRKFIPVETK